MEAHVFIDGHGCSQGDGFEITNGELGVASGDGAVDDALGSGDLGRWGADVAWIRE